MDDDVKRKISIGIAVVCILFAAGIAYKTYFSGGSGGGGARGPIQMLCVNPKCGATLEVSQDELMDMMQGQGSEEAMMMTQTPVFVCPECKEKSLYIAQKCEKCGKVFVPNHQDPENYDRCPECGFSKYEEMRKKR